MATILGTPGDDDLDGTNAADLMLLRRGDDVGAGLRGDDLLLSDGGDDRLFGGLGRDRLFGGVGNDALDGESGDDVLNGNAGDDLLSGGRGNDVLRGGDGNDALFGRSGDDLILGGAGRDLLAAGGGTNTLTGGDGVDRFRSTATDNVPLGLTFAEFEAALDDPFNIEEFLIAAIADGDTDIITDAGDRETLVVDAGFAVAEVRFSFIAGIDLDADGDGDGFDGLGALTFKSAAGQTSLKLLFLPDSYLRAEFELIETATGARLEFFEF